MARTDNVDKCAKCIYWWNADMEDEDLGLCRRYPPMLKGEGETSNFPCTCEDDWCGEFK